MRTSDTSRTSRPRKGHRAKTAKKRMPTLAVVSRAEAGLPLVDFLSRHLQLSRKRAKALVDSRGVFVNRSPVWMARHPLRNGDSVEVAFRELLPAASHRLDILFRDEHYIVVDKSSGVLSNGRDSIESLCRERFTCSGSLRAAHRIDKDTSGCLLLALSPSALEQAVSLFRSRQVKKHYHAVTRGRFPYASQTVERPLDGQRAVTRVRRLDSNAGASHLRLRILTGRTHQVRRHLALLGHPVVGERRYARGQKETDESVTVARQMLHASTLAFQHPVTGKNILVRSPLPPDFRACLKTYGLK